MKLTRFAAPALAVALLSVSGAAFAQGYGPPPGPPPGYGQGPGPGGWDAPPQAFREFQQRGYRDGVEGARKDFENRRPPNPNNRDEFRHPNFIPREMRRDYRDGFRQGYNSAVRHMWGGPR
jgi:hypothetical protein